MKLLTLSIITLSLISCGPRRPGKLGAEGKQGEEGKAGASTAIDISGAHGICPNGGVILTSFYDYNKDGGIDIGELVQSVGTVCNGIDGENASVNLETLPAGINCPTGGVLISSSSGSAQVVCNGINGLNGPQGIQGVQGVPGLNGVAGLDGEDGTSVVPVKFCSDSTAPFPEYGLMIGNDIFAVYYDHPKAAFLAKLTPGSYRTTTDNQDCNFTIE